MCMKAWPVIKMVMFSAAVCRSQQIHGVVETEKKYCLVTMHTLFDNTGVFTCNFYGAICLLCFGTTALFSAKPEQHTHHETSPDQSLVSSVGIIM